MSAQSRPDRLLAILKAAPDHGGWRVGMDDDDYLSLVDALLAHGVTFWTDAYRDAADVAICPADATMLRTLANVIERGMETA